MIRYLSSVKPLLCLFSKQKNHEFENNLAPSRSIITCNVFFTSPVKYGNILLMMLPSQNCEWFHISICILTGNILLSVGNYKKCTVISMVTINEMKQTCGYLCDVTDAATMEIRMLSTTPSTDQPAICDVKLC